MLDDTEHSPQKVHLVDTNGQAADEPKSFAEWQSSRIATWATFEDLCSKAKTLLEKKRRRNREQELEIGRVLLAAKKVFDHSHPFRGQRGSFVKAVNDQAGITRSLCYRLIGLARRVQDGVLTEDELVTLTWVDIDAISHDQKDDLDIDDPERAKPSETKRNSKPREGIQALTLAVGSPHRIQASGVLIVTPTRVTATKEQVRHALARAEEFDGLEVVLPNPIIHADLAGVKRWIPPEPKLDEPEPPQERLTVVQGKAEGGMLN